jgi:hypothetical protein
LRTWTSPIWFRQSRAKSSDVGRHRLGIGDEGTDLVPAVRGRADPTELVEPADVDELRRLGEA